MESLPPPGTFLLSIDTELAWGGVHTGTHRRSVEHYEETRKAVKGLLALLEAYGIRATWATVGHLFLDHCQLQEGVKHPEIDRPSYSWFRGDWFDSDPCSNLDRDPAWYGADILKQILACRVPQEIGCHGFSHMIVGDPGCHSECFDSELKACGLQAQRWGVNLESFVFPRNSVGHLRVLAENGYKAFRGPTPGWYTRFPNHIRRIARVLDSLLPVSPPATSPRWEGGLWNLPASYFYPHREGWAKLVPVSLSVHKVNLGLDSAVCHNKTFHLWFHPFNLASDSDRLLGGLESIFQRVQTLVEAGKLSNPTMGDLAASLTPSKEVISA